jgi:hypothetical protein
LFWRGGNTKEGYTLLIHNTQRAKQLIDFDGLSIRNIVPTDIDAVIEYRDLAYVWIEVKYMGKDVPFGQRLCITRFIKDAAKVGKLAIGIIAEHSVHDAKVTVMLSDCNVREVFWGSEQRWRPPNSPGTVKQLVDSFIGMVDNAHMAKVS